MVNTRIIEILISFITIGIAYTISATCAGYVQAWTAKQFGDDSLSTEEFLTLNPLVHIDPIGSLCLFFLGVGWGKLIPINPANIRSTVGLLLVYLSRPFAYMSIAFFSLLILLKVFGLKILTNAMMVVLTENISLSGFAKIYPEKSSFILALALILVMLVYIGVLFAVLNFIIGGFRFAMLTFLQHLSRSEHGDLLTFIIPFFLLVLLARPLKVLVVYGIFYSAYFIAPLLGVV